MPSLVERLKAKLGFKPSRPPDQVVVLGTAHETDSASAIGVSVDYPSNRGWKAHWESLVAELQQLETLCGSGNYAGNDIAQRAFIDFFVRCHHMADQLWEGSSPTLNKAVVVAFWTNDPDVRISEGICNTYKHMERDNPTAMTAEVSNVTGNETGTTVRITWRDGQGSGSEDALDLARRSVTAWEGFLRGQGLL